MKQQQDHTTPPDFRYKGYLLQFYTNIYDFSGYRVISPEGIDFGHLFDTAAEAIQAVNDDINF